MRALFVTFQLCILGGAYLLLALPVWAAVTGLAYALAVEAETVGAAAMFLGAESALHYSLQALGALPAGAAAPAAAAALSSLAGAASTLLTIAAPLLATALVNLVLGIAARYRDWHEKARRWAIGCNVIVLLCYLAVQAVVLHAARGQTASGETDGVTAGIIRFMAAAMLLWDSYFVISILLLCRMPRRPDAGLTVRRARLMHFAIWGALLAAWVGALIVAGTAVNIAAAIQGGSTAAAVTPGVLVNTATVIGSVILLLAFPFFAVNAWASGKIYSERRKRFVVVMLIANAALALVSLFLLPPVGVALALSAVWLCFVVEVTFLNGKQESAPPGAASKPI